MNYYCNFCSLNELVKASKTMLRRKSNLFVEANTSFGLCFSLSNCSLFSLSYQLTQESLFSSHENTENLSFIACLPSSFLFEEFCFFLLIWWYHLSQHPRASVNLTRYLQLITMLIKRSLIFTIIDIFRCWDFAFTTSFSMTHQFHRTPRRGRVIFWMDAKDHHWGRTRIQLVMIWWS